MSGFPFPSHLRPTLDIPHVVIVVVSPQLQSSPFPTRRDRTTSCHALCSPPRERCASLTPSWRMHVRWMKVVVAPGVGKEAGTPAHNRVEASRMRQGKERNTSYSHENQMERHEGNKERIAEVRCSVGMGRPRADRPAHDRGDAHAIVSLTKLALWRWACLQIQDMRRADRQGQDVTPNVRLSMSMRTSSCQTTLRFPSKWTSSGMEHHSCDWVGSDQSCCACCARPWRVPRARGRVVDAGRFLWC